MHPFNKLLKVDNWAGNCKVKEASIYYPGVLLLSPSLFSMQFLSREGKMDDVNLPTYHIPSLSAEERGEVGHGLHSKGASLAN